MELLDKINSPSDLRGLPPGSLKQVAKEIRKFLLQVVSEKGGHLASNLGTVELTLALHYIFNTPDDKIIWDVGHQSYPHKILTGRRDQFHTIRQREGLSGFTSRAESPYDHFGAGHASTSLSAALGIAEAMKHSGLSHLAIGVIGDGSLTGGLAFEALNNAGHIPAKNLVVVLNDNDMSIDPNVGGLRKFVNHAVTHPAYNRMRKELRSVLKGLDQRGVRVASAVSKLHRSVKNILTPGILFECFGFRYFGPLDGHDMDELIEIFSFIKSEGATGGPYLVHALTTKGKGYKRAEELPLKYHGVTPFKVDDGILPSAAPKRPAYQDVFADTLIRLAKEDPRIIAVTAAMPSGTGIAKFQKEFPGRTYDVGIAEAHAVCFSAAMATEGYRPVAAIYSTFLQRAYDQVIHDVGIQNLGVVFAMDRAGVVGADGVTHQGAFDLTYLRAVPNLVIMAPKDENELQHMVKTAVEHAGPIALRYPRGEVVGVSLDKELRCYPIGEGELVDTDGEDVQISLVAVGYAVQTAIEAAKKLRAKGYSVAILNARFVKPLDEKLLLHWASHSKLLVTVEENTLLGGFGAAVLELLQANSVLKHTLVVGLPDRFIDHATQSEQRAQAGLDSEGVTAQTIAKFEKCFRKSSAKKPSFKKSDVSSRHLPLQ